MQYSYPCRIEPDGDGWVASFPDVAEALTGDGDYGETVELAADALVTALSRCYVERRRELPPPGARTPGEILIRVPALVAGKLALYSTMRRNRITRVELARRLAVSVTTARRIVNPQHRSHIEQVERALRAVGRVLVVDDRAPGREHGPAVDLPGTGLPSE